MRTGLIRTPKKVCTVHTATVISYNSIMPLHKVMEAYKSVSTYSRNPMNIKATIKQWMVAFFILGEETMRSLKNFFISPFYIPIPQLLKSLL